MQPADLTFDESLSELADWNRAVYRRWANMTAEEQAKATKYTRKEWAQRTAHCIVPGTPTNLEAEIT